MLPPLNNHIRETKDAYNHLVEHLVPTVKELNDWLPTLQDVAPAQIEELRALGPQANWSADPYAAVFRQYVTEHRRVLIEDYMAEHLSTKEFAAWLDFHGRDGGHMLESLTRKI